jgi:hypothetical protein
VAAQGFAGVSAVTRRSPTRFAADVDPGWTIGGKPNGGYLLAMLGRAAIAAGGHPDVLAASAHYLRAPEPGPVEIEATVLRAGRSAGQARVRMAQDGQDCVEALLTTGRLDPADAPYWSGGVPAPGEYPFADCERVAWELPDGRHVAIMREVDVRLEPPSAGFARGEPSGRGELRGWLALPGGEPFDAVSLLYAVDAFPPATFDVAMSGWVPTFELTAYVRAVPAPGPVRVLQRARLIQGHRVDEACFVWDGDGRLVAQATQLAGIRLVF